MTDQTERDTHVPAVLARIQTINSYPAATRSFPSLLDSGSSSILIHRRALPRNVVPQVIPHVQCQTTAGTFTVTHQVTLTDVQLPEFSRARKLEHFTALVFDSPCRYDLILGRTFLSSAGIKFDFEDHTMTWLDLTIAMPEATNLPHHPQRLRDTLQTNALLADLYEESYAYYEKSYHRIGEGGTILESKYEKQDVVQVAQDQQHLTQEQRDQLQKVLEEFPTLFNGELGRYPHTKVHLELEPDAKPVHQRPYSVPHRDQEVFKKELDRLVQIGVLSPIGATEWAAPSFISPKKDGRVRWISDFRALNKCIKRRVYPLPRIYDILHRRSGYAFLTKLDLSMQYYTFELDDESKELCTIITPFGKYNYNRLPMGIKQAPDIAQEVMETVLRNLEETDAFIDDVGIFNDDWESHLASLRKVLQRLEENGFTINPLKCEWAVQETDWLGYWLTPTGLKPWKKKVDAILKMQPPSNLKEARSFIGAVSYYRDMWPKRSHILAPLTQFSAKTPFVWTAEQQKAFDTMKSLIAADALLAYPDHNKPFNIETDASDLQLGAVIKQDGRPLAYYSRKLNSAQRNYTTIEKELLSIVETLKEFRNMLLGAEVHIHTDHKNLTYQMSSFTTQRVLRWRLYCEEFSPTFHYLPGPSNTIADPLSRLPRSPDVESSADVSAARIVDDLQMMECFLHHPSFAGQHDVYPLHYDTIANFQQQDQELQQARNRQPQRYIMQQFEQQQLVCYRPEATAPWRIAIPTNMLEALVSWYHRVSSHTGMHRLYDTISTHFYHPRLQDAINRHVRTCRACQQYKNQGRGYGELPPREALAAPWYEVAVDLVGPWSIHVQGQELVFHALSCIDPVTGLLELPRIDNKTAEHVGMKFENNWLARYPRPYRCVHDNGGEFTGHEFQQILTANGIHDSPTTVKNPQSNAICERVHQTVENVLMTLLKTHPPDNVNTAAELMDSALATAVHATRCVVHGSTGFSPGALSFHRDMFLNIPLVADLLLLQQRRQNIIDENLRRANNKRISFDYQVGQQALLRLKSKSKLGDRTEGPFTIETVHANGTLTVRRRPNMTERINIRRLRPLHT